jgi:hypothetical protein
MPWKLLGQPHGKRRTCIGTCRTQSFRAGSDRGPLSLEPGLAPALALGSPQDDHPLGPSPDTSVQIDVLTRVHGQWCAIYAWPSSGPRGTARTDTLVRMPPGCRTTTDVASWTVQPRRSELRRTRRRSSASGRPSPARCPVRDTPSRPSAPVQQRLLPSPRPGQEVVEPLYLGRGLCVAPERKFCKVGLEVLCLRWQIHNHRTSSQVVAEVSYGAHAPVRHDTACSVSVEACPVC